MGGARRGPARNGTARQARHGLTWQATASRGVAGGARRGRDRRYEDWLGKAGVARLRVLGLESRGEVWQARHGRAGRGMAWQRKAGEAWQGAARRGSARRDTVWQGRRGLDRCGPAGLGAARHGKAGAAGCGAAWIGVAGRGTAGEAWAGSDGLGTAWFGNARRGTARQARNIVDICSDCKQAETDPWHIGVTHAGRLCCLARSLALSPRKFQAEAAVALTRGLSPQDADAVKARAREILRGRVPA